MAEQPRAEHDEKRLTEAEYLERETERAKAAMARAWDDAKAKLLRGVDPRVWAGAHPWYALTGATVAGFLAACSMVPTKREAALKQIAELNKAFARHDAGDEPDDKPAAESAEIDDRPVRDASRVDADRSPGILSTLGMQVIRAVGPTVISAIAAAITAKETVDAETNGKAADPAPPPAPTPDEAGDYTPPT